MMINFDQLFANAGAKTVYAKIVRNGVAVDVLDPINIDGEDLKLFARETLDRVGAKGVYVNRPNYATDNGSRIHYEYTKDGDRLELQIHTVTYGGGYPVKLHKFN